MQSITLQLTPEMLTLMMSMGIPTAPVVDDKVTLNVPLNRSFRDQISQQARIEGVTQAQLLQLMFAAFLKLPAQVKNHQVAALKTTAPLAQHG